MEGVGTGTLYSNPSFETINADVSFGPVTDLICDAHDIPFQDETFDCAIAQAVLEHVLDPYRCVLEMHRVLKPNGIFVLTFTNSGFINKLPLVANSNVFSSYSINDIKKLISETGFNLVRVEEKEEFVRSKRGEEVKGTYFSCFTKKQETIVNFIIVNKYDF